MRITDGMMLNSFRFNLNRNLTSLTTLQENLSSGRRLIKPSDDPVATISSLRYRTTILETEEYMEKIETAKDYLDTTDSTLDKVTSIIHRTRELLVGAANGTNSDESKKAISAEIRQLKEQLGIIANTTFGSKHIFGGTNVTTQPYDAANDQWVGNNDTINLEIGTGVTIPVNSVMGDFFWTSDPADPGIIQLLEQIANNIDAGNDAGMQQNLGQLEDKLDQLLLERANIGAKINRLDMQLQRLEATKINYSDLLSRNEDADIAQVIIDLKTKENVYRSSLAAGARIIQPTLVDFLR